jgi:large subunit ribosomal protein L25
MNEVHLKVKRRLTGKQSVKQTRNAGLVPGIFYKKDSENIPIAIDPKSLRPVVYTSKTKMINLEVEGDPTIIECVVKEVIFNPVTDQVTHFDLVGIERSHKMSFDIPVAIKGTAIGVREGGVLEFNLRKVTVHCMPQFMPSSIEVDVTHLGIGKTIHLKDILIDNVEYGIPLDTVVVHVTAPRVVEKAAVKPGAPGAPAEAIAPEK